MFNITHAVVSGEQYRSAQQSANAAAMRHVALATTIADSDREGFATLDNEFN